MMNTRRLLVLAACGIFLFTLVGAAQAQSRTDTTPATKLPVAEDSVAMLAAVAAANMAYESLAITWDVGAAYWRNCGTETGESQTACADGGSETPLTGFVVYYSTDPFDSANRAGVMSKSTSGGTTAFTTGKAKYTLEGLDPKTEYYINVAPVNSFGTGIIVPANGDVGETADAPKPAIVTGVMVEPGDKMLTVSWDPADPDEMAERTNLLVEEYHIRYRTSQTDIKTAGEWMPMEPMEVMGDMTTTMIEMLTNDVSYDVQVRAENNAEGKGGWSSQTPRSKGTPTAMTPTPALPLFGAFGLGVGLLAAGRARMRQRRQALLRGRR
jgi:hypothetical protein